MTRSLSLLAALFAAIATTLATPDTASAAERRVVGEMFTATWCVPCRDVRAAGRLLQENFPDSFYMVEIHQADAYTIPWGNSRASFYGVPGYPTVWFDGVIEKVGDSGTIQQNYNQMLGFLNQRTADQTSVSVEIAGTHVSGNTYEIVALVKNDAGAPSQTCRFYCVQNLDNYPVDANYPYSNTLIQAAATEDFVLAGGETRVIERTMTFSGASATNWQDLSILAWVQHPAAGGPSEAYNTAWMWFDDNHDFPNFDCNGNGIPDFDEISGGTAEDCNQNGLPDECDIADGMPDENGDGIPDACGDCNGNGEMDWMDIADGTAQDCNENGLPDSCDVASAASGDCNGNGTPDECEVSWTFSALSAQIGPIGSTAPANYIVADPEMADLDDDVVLDFTAFGDFAQVFETMSVSLNGAPIGTLFSAGGAACSEITGQLLVPAATWNFELLSEGSITLSMTCSGAVDAGACGGSSWIQVETTHGVQGDNDADDDGVPDDCGGDDCADVDDDGEVGFSDLLQVLGTWGPCVGCPADVDDDGEVGFSDLLQVLGAWGPCP